MKKLTKGAFATDIHFGKKSNSQQHNEDCINYLRWFCEQVEQEGDIDYIGFLGDWNENRSALNVATLNYSYHGAKLINNLGLPVYFCVGNHDLYHRHTREIHSVIPFQEFSNFIVINEPTVINEIEGKALFSPYLFHDEYPTLAKYTKLPFWAGHFEFKGFVVTGYSMTMPTGPDHTLYQGPTHIISGHFHKRQTGDNIVYMGNTFPMDFSDAGDTERGMMIYDHTKQEMKFNNWTDCPKYIKTSVSRLLDGKTKMPVNARVKCLLDIPLTFEEINELKTSFVTTYNLRDFATEEPIEIVEALTATELLTEVGDIAIDGIDELVIQMLQSIDTKHIDNSLLIDQYRRLKA